LQLQGVAQEVMSVLVVGAARIWKMGLCGFEFSAIACHTM
jgi:hypothetical protein